MRKITREACDAFVNGRDFSSGNTSVIDNGATRMYLHGNMIAERSDGTTKVTLAGWPTPTTRERVNGVLAALDDPRRIYQRGFAQYIGANIDDSEREITAFEWLVL
jgi:hypothetical protein